MYLRILASLPPTVFTYASLHRSQLASEQYYVPAMDRELWNQFAPVLTRHGSDPQNIKFAYSMEELMLQLAFYEIGRASCRERV